MKFFKCFGPDVYWRIPYCVPILNVIRGQNAITGGYFDTQIVVFLFHAKNSIRNLKIITLFIPQSTKYKNSTNSRYNMKNIHRNLNKDINKDKENISRQD
jgi:hypothetical protein